MLVTVFWERSCLWQPVGYFSAMCIALLSKIEIAAKRQQFWYSLQAVMLAIFNGWIALSLQMV